MAAQATAGGAPKARAPKWLGELSNALFGRRFPRWDAFMVILAAVDVVALLLRRELELPEPWADLIVRLDWALVAFFAGEFVVSLARSGEPGRFVRANWYDLVGLVPLPVAFLRVFRLLRVPHILIWGSRFPSRAEREFGGAYAVALFRRYEPVIVEDLTDPVLIRLLDVLRQALARGRYAQAIGEGLDQRRDRLRESVLRALQQKPALRLALAAPGAKAAVAAIEDELVDIFVAMLTDPELDAVIKESMDDALRELQTRIAEKERGLVPVTPAP